LTICLCNSTFASFIELERLVIAYKIVIDDKVNIVMYNNRQFSIKFIKKGALAYIISHYYGETAESWIMLHCYRSRKGNLIYLVFEDGKRVEAGKYLIKRLREIESIE